MIYTDDAVNLLEGMGLTPVVMDSPKEPDKSLFFIGKKVVWGKLFTYIKENRPDINDYIETVPHFNWIKNIIISRNPELQVVEVEGREYSGVKFPEIIDRSDKLVHLDKCLGYIFAMISEVLVKELSRFE